MEINIVPVPEKGDLTKTDNYRGISLTSIFSKTLIFECKSVQDEILGATAVLRI